MDPNQKYTFNQIQQQSNTFLNTVPAPEIPYKYDCMDKYKISSISYETKTLFTKILQEKVHSFFFIPSFKD